MEVRGKMAHIFFFGWMIRCFIVASFFIWSTPAGFFGQVQVYELRIFILVRDQRLYVIYVVTLYDVVNICEVNMFKHCKSSRRLK